jgi:hypothetical protein
MKKKQKFVVTVEISIESNHWVDAETIAKSLTCNPLVLKGTVIVKTYPKHICEVI